MLWLATLDNGHLFTKPICFLCLGFYSKVDCRTLTPTSTFFERRNTAPAKSFCKVNKFKCHCKPSHICHTKTQLFSGWPDGFSYIHHSIHCCPRDRSPVSSAPHVSDATALGAYDFTTTKPCTQRLVLRCSMKKQGKGLDFSIFILHLKVWLFDIFWLVRHPSQTTTMVWLVWFVCSQHTGVHLHHSQMYWKLENHTIDKV